MTLLGCGSSAATDLFNGDGGSGGQGQGGSAAGGAGGAGGTFGAAGAGGSGGSGAIGGVGGTLGVGGSFGGSAGTAGDGGAGSAGGGGNCDFGGTWAAYATIPMTWPQTQVLAAGSGTLQVWLLTRRTVNGMATAEVGNLCGITLPPFATILNEKHGVRFLGEVFDHMPDFTINANVGAYEVGGSFNTEPAAIIFGARLNDPVRDPWPPVTSLVTADDDRDYNAGVTTQSEKGDGYFDPIVDLVTFQRASVVFVASRTVVVVHGTATSCDELRGELEIPSIGGNAALDSHIVGCKVASTGATCTAAQYQFVDTNGPDFQPAPGTTFLQRRVPDDFTCAQVRGMYAPLP